MNEHLGELQRVLRDDRFGVERHDAVEDEADVERRAADVGADHVVLAVQPAEVLTAEDAAGRARVQRHDRALGGVGDGGQAAARLHHEEGAVQPLGAKPVLELLQIRHDLRSHVGRDGGGRRTLVLPEHGGDLVGVGAEDRGRTLGDDLLDAALVAIVDERPQERDRDGLDAFVEQAVDRLDDLVLLELDDDVAVPVDALRHAANEAAGDDRVRLPKPGRAHEITLG